MFSLPNKTELLDPRFLFKREIIPPLLCHLWAPPVYFSCFIGTFWLSLWYFKVFKSAFGVCWRRGNVVWANSTWHVTHRPPHGMWVPYLFSIISPNIVVALLRIKIGIISKKIGHVWNCLIYFSKVEDFMGLKPVWCCFSCNSFKLK